MESVLRFMESGNSLGLKLVPWISWDEWNSIHIDVEEKRMYSCSCGCYGFNHRNSTESSFFQEGPRWNCSAIRRNAFNAILHGNYELCVDELAFLKEQNQHKNGNYFSRLVNGVVEKIRKKAEISIAEAANAIGIPRMLIDVRHEGSHRDLPSLQLVRLASTKVLDWLTSYYWEPHMNAIRRDSTASLRKEIRHKLLEMACCLKVKQTNSSPTSEKRIRLGQLCARNKFLPFISGKLPYSKTVILFSLRSVTHGSLAELLHLLNESLL